MEKNMDDRIAKQDIIDIIKLVLENDVNITMDDCAKDLSVFGMESIHFIQVVIALEEKFECEIPDSKLIFSEMNTVDKIYDILLSINAVLS